jgi:hypothetical protein
VKSVGALGLLNDKLQISFRQACAFSNVCVVFGCSSGSISFSRAATVTLKESLSEVVPGALVRRLIGFNRVGDWDRFRFPDVLPVERGDWGVDEIVTWKTLSRSSSKIGGGWDGDSAVEVGHSCTTRPNSGLAKKVSKELERFVLPTALCNTASMRRNEQDPVGRRQ